MGPTVRAWLLVISWLVQRKVGSHFRWEKKVEKMAKGGDDNVRALKYSRTIWRDNNLEVRDVALTRLMDEGKLCLVADCF